MAACGSPSYAGQLALGGRIHQPRQTIRPDETLSSTAPTLRYRCWNIIIVRVKNDRGATGALMELLPHRSRIYHRYKLDLWYWGQTFLNVARIWLNRVHILLYGFLKVNLRPPSAAVSTSFAKFAIFATYAALKAATQSICRQLCLSAGSWWCIRRALTCLEKRINRVMKCKMTFIHACADFTPEIFTGMEAQIGKKHSNYWKTALCWFICQVGWSGSQVMWLGQVVGFQVTWSGE